MRMRMCMGVCMRMSMGASRHHQRGGDAAATQPSAHRPNRTRAKERIAAADRLPRQSHADACAGAYSTATSYVDDAEPPRSSTLTAACSTIRAEESTVTLVVTLLESDVAAACTAAACDALDGGRDGTESEPRSLPATGTLAREFASAARANAAPTTTPRKAGRRLGASGGSI